MNCIHILSQNQDFVKNFCEYFSIKLDKVNKIHYYIYGDYMLSDKLKSLRTQKGLTQGQLAEILGVERSTIAKYEGKGNVMPSHEVLFAIAAYFGVTYDFLLGAPERKDKTTLNFEVSDDSMEPKFSKNDVAIVHKQKTAKTNDIALLSINGEPLIRKIKLTDDGILLIPSNPNYEILFFSNSELHTSDFEILGKIVELHCKF